MKLMAWIDKQGFALLEAVPDAIVIADSPGAIEFVNQSAERLFGYPRAELLGQSIEMLLPERYRGVHEADRGRFLAQPSTRHMGSGLDLWGRRKDGSEFAADISLAPLKTDEGISVVAAVHNLTEARREREGLAALHEVAVESSGLLDPALLGKLVVDRACALLGGRNALLVWWDPIKASLGVLADNDERPIGGPIAVGEGASGLAFQRGEPVVVEDYPSWEQALPDVLARGNKSVVAVPLRVRDRPVGALVVAFSTTRRLGRGELLLMELLAAQVAPALEAARLHEAVLSMQDYQRLFENAPDPMWVADAETMAILAVNQLTI
jgi:PAS domain S-box-containing protein